MHLTEVVYLYKQYTSYIQIKEVKQRTVAVISQICLVSPGSETSHENEKKTANKEQNAGEMFSETFRPNTVTEAQQRCFQIISRV